MIKRTEYLFIGAKINEDKEQQNHDNVLDFYKPYMNGKNDITCIFTQGYIFLGEIILEAERTMCFNFAIHKDGQALRILQVDTFEFESKKIEMRSKIYKEFQRFLNVGIWIITG